MPAHLREFRQTPEVDPRPWVDDLRDRRRLDARDASWLHRLLDRLAPAALEESPLHLCHGDVNAANVLMPSTPENGIVLIDWAGAGWLDPAWDFVGVPMEVVPFLLAGHRSVAPLPRDDTAEARICWSQAQTRLLAARSQADDATAIVGLQRDVASLRAFAATGEWTIG
jgi:aminoglycoside phosphotransferase (APT) family kinase protein